ncbi:Molybdenum-containing formylmethanofuran dehydrogenase 1 subunit C [Clarias magur]|uniref:Molybdenum-containing formylmethanofuran dehydrogenase 1 subunit C n=1 Tax=Clarias magur TaxID=1594786 RepID=A0A8J4U731_CLAMG|nr:Molybdenum-containing formylmethanofuran dehydrogenase 1 subunit C [Clarias magur]
MAVPRARSLAVCVGNAKHYELFLASGFLLAIRSNSGLHYGTTNRNFWHRVRSSPGASCLAGPNRRILTHVSMS